MPLVVARFSRSSLAAVLTGGVLLTGAGAAHAASIQLAPGCFHSGGAGLLTGAGFRPDASWTAKLRGTQRLGSGRTDRKGRIRARFTAPAYSGTTGERVETLSVTDGPHVASRSFSLTPLTASFSPTTGDPNTMRVRWRVLGLGADSAVFVHYIAPNGKLRKSVRIGHAQGACGHLKTAPTRLFPFPISYGRWTFQIDAHSGYSKATVPRLLIQYDVKKPAPRPTH